MTFLDLRWALQALAEKRVGTRVRQAEAEEDATFAAGKRAASGVQ